MIGSPSRFSANAYALEDDSVQERDFLWNILTVFLVLIGGAPALLAAPGLADGPPGDPPPAIDVFLSPAGDLRIDTADSPARPMDTVIGEIVRRTAGAAGESTIVLHHGPETPSGDLYAVLRRIAGVPRSTAYLALEKPGATPQGVVGAPATGR